MKTRQLVLTVAVSLAFSACNGAADPVGPDLPLAHSVANACYDVAGSLVRTLVGADFPNGIFYFDGPITWSLEGTSLSALTASENPAEGRPRNVSFGAGTRTVSVTGGSVAALVGSTLVFELEQTNIAGTSPSVRSGERATLVSGARNGQLTIHGRFDPATASLTAGYHGSICP